MFSLEILPFLRVFGIGDEIATTHALLADVGIFASAELLPPLEPVPDSRRRLLPAAYDLAAVRHAARTSSRSVT